MFSGTEPERAIVNVFTAEAEKVGMISRSGESGDPEGNRKRRGEGES
jgi:hypothetical protein